MTSSSSTTNVELVSCKTLSTFGCHEMNPRPKYNEINLRAEHATPAIPHRERAAAELGVGGLLKRYNQGQFGRDKPGRAPSTGRKLIVPIGVPQAKVPERKSAEKRTPKSKVVPMHGQVTDDELDDVD
ncbi:hypothetical protein T492DRAFT_863608 [Pavlovales sp. CCMP2436]|nr:hypothetical protein T492DRAFT_863608 [Pavlovales sp. CCMP2436]